MPDTDTGEPADRIDDVLTPGESVWGRDNPDIPTPQEEHVGTDAPSNNDRLNALHYAVQYNHGVASTKVVEDARLFEAYLKGNNAAAS